MLKKQYEDILKEQSEIALFDFEKAYLEQIGVSFEDKMITEKALTFDVLEVCSKETEDTLRAVEADFLGHPISYLKENQAEFIYAESSAFDAIRVDAFALEFDDAFNLNTVLFGLKLQKKYSEAIRTYLKQNVKSALGSSSAAFSGQEGLWEINIALDCLEGYSDDLSFEAIYGLLYKFIFDLIVAAES
ncbi:MAG: protoporphyrinogen oxidase [Solibacillus sp.]